MLFFGMVHNKPIDVVSFIWVLLSPTRTLSVKGGARPSGWSIMRKRMKFDGDATVDILFVIVCE